MAAFLETIRKSDNRRSFYVDGCRVTRASFHSLGTGEKSCLQTEETATHWRFRHERPL